MIAYKALTKTQLTKDAGISINTLRKWIQQDWDILHSLGLQTKTKILEPAIVQFLAEKHKFVPHNAKVI